MDQGQKVTLELTRDEISMLGIAINNYNVYLIKKQLFQTSLAYKKLYHVLKTATKEEK